MKFTFFRRKVFLLLIIICCLSINGCSPKASNAATGGLLTQEKLNKVIEKMDITDIEKVYDTGIDSSGAEKVKDTPRGFKYGALRVVIGKNAQGRKVKLFVDPYNNENPEDTAFTIDVQ